MQSTHKAYARGWFPKSIMALGSGIRDHGVAMRGLRVEFDRETDGRWIADIPELPGVTVYGVTPEEATIKAKALALRVVVEEIEHGEIPAGTGTLQFSMAA